MQEKMTEEALKNETLDAKVKMDEVSDSIERAIEDEMEQDCEKEIVEDTEKEDTDSSKNAKAFFKKDKKEKKDKKDQQIEDLTDRLMRNMAEFENFRKRSEKEKSQMFEIGAKDIVERILPVLDNFERGFSAISEEERSGAFAQGIEKIYKQLVTNLEEAGVKPIEAVGQQFDPDFHNAVMHAEDEEYGENTVSEEFLKGYLYKESVVRHSMVKVVN